MLSDYNWSMQVRKDGTVPWLRPDGKTQVTIEYKKDGGAMIPIRVHTILISTQHSPDVTNDKIHADLMEYVIKPVVPSKYLDDSTIFHLNPSGAPLYLQSGCSLACLQAFWQAAFMRPSCVAEVASSMVWKWPCTLSFAPLMRCLLAPDRCSPAF